MHLIDEPSAELDASLANFRRAVRDWSEHSHGRRPASEMRWTVIPAQDHLARLLLPEAVDGPWYGSLSSNLRDCLRRDRPPLDITSKPVLVRDIWGQYGRQKKSWAMSLALQSAAVLVLFTAASSRIAPRQTARLVTLLAPNLAEYMPKAARPHEKMGGGGGGGDHSPLPPSKGRLPKAALRQFTPPRAVVNNFNPRLSMEPSIVVPPDVSLPQVNMAQYGDPLGKLGPPSNGPGSDGGIGNGKHGGVGPGEGVGYGPGKDGGVGGGVFEVGSDGATAPRLISKVEPEYSEEARTAKYQGTVLLGIDVDANGRAVNVRVLRSLGLGLDEKAIEAVKKWRFQPGSLNGRPVAVRATIEVNFRLL